MGSLCEFKLDHFGQARFEYSLHDPDYNISYGLNLRKKSDYMDDDERPQFIALASLEAVLLHKLKDDLERRSEDRSMEEFTDILVEGFGATLLISY